MLKLKTYLLCIAFSCVQISNSFCTNQEDDDVNNNNNIYPPLRIKDNQKDYVPVFNSEGNEVYLDDDGRIVIEKKIIVEKRVPFERSTRYINFEDEEDEKPIVKVEDPIVKEVIKKEIVYVNKYLSKKERRWLRKMERKKRKAHRRRLKWLRKRKLF